MIKGYVERAFNEIVKDEIVKEKIMQKFTQKFKNISEDMCTTKRWKTACRIVAKNGQ